MRIQNLGFTLRLNQQAPSGRVGVGLIRFGQWVELVFGRLLLARVEKNTVWMRPETFAG
jgi:hypothetical protein